MRCEGRAGGLPEEACICLCVCVVAVTTFTPHMKGPPIKTRQKHIPMTKTDAVQHYIPSACISPSAGQTNPLNDSFPLGELLSPQGPL